MKYFNVFFIAQESGRIFTWEIHRVSDPAVRQCMKNSIIEFFPR